ncbi:hypothetical protein GA372_06710 [Bacteroides xylanisolvens]|nr:hypothetical protein GA372_06710 [Bacteroides xylanisolvens]
MVIFFACTKQDKQISNERRIFFNFIFQVSFICSINENLSVRLKALQLYIYWGALKGLNYIA